MLGRLKFFPLNYIFPPQNYKFFFNISTLKGRLVDQYFYIVSCLGGLVGRASVLYKLFHSIIDQIISRTAQYTSP